MNHLRGADREWPRTSSGTPGVDLDDVERKFPAIRAGPRKEHFQRRIEPLARARRTGDDQRALAQAQQLGVEQEERQRRRSDRRADAQHDAVDGVRVDVLRFQRDKR